MPAAPAGRAPEDLGPVAVLVTAYREAPRIEAAIAGLREAFGADVRIVVADDASPDDTAERAAGAGVELVRSPRNQGKGGAATLGARRLEAWALGQAQGGLAPSAGAGPAEREPVVVLCDGDLAASAAHLPALVRAVREAPADVAVARFAVRAGGGVGLARGVARWGLRRRTGLVLEAPISGQRAVRGHLVAHLLPFAPRFGMEVGMTIDAVRAGARVVEVELPLEHRATGRTPAGFLHRGRQLVDILLALHARR